MKSTPDAVSDAGGDEEVQPLRDDDDTATATDRDPDESTDPQDEIPPEDLPVSEVQPETQGEDPVSAELGEEGEGDLLPEDF